MINDLLPSCSVVSFYSLAFEPWLCGNWRKDLKMSQTLTQCVFIELFFQTTLVILFYKKFFNPYV